MAGRVAEFNGQAQQNAPDQLPTNDVDRLFFYTEVMVANVPVLIADLSSPKYTFLSISKKTRNEVKQKSALIQSISRTYNNVISIQRQRDQKAKELSAAEVQLVTAAPPRFMTRAEALDRTVANGGDGEGKSHEGTVMILEEEDMALVRAAEMENARVTDELASLSRQANEMEAAFASAREQYEGMTQHVKSLKTQNDDLQRQLAEAQHQRRMIAVQKQEHLARRRIAHEAMAETQALETQCRREELQVIEGSIAAANAAVDAMRTELRQRKEKHEVELAAYQIAYKEAQATMETLKDDIDFFHKHQRELELLAKRQQQDESKQNSLKRLVMQTLAWSSSKSKSGEQALPPALAAEVEADHALISVLAANIFEMETQRNDVAGIIAQVENAFDNGAVRSSMDRVVELLSPAITLDEDALNR